MMTVEANRSSALEAAFERSNVMPAFQPVVDLRAGQVVGYEALARWPAVAGASPDAVFGHARQVGRLVELDELCRSVAIDTAIDAGLGSEIALFINVEPVSLAAMADLAGHDELEPPLRSLRIVLELTERALLMHPSQLLRQVARAREVGWGIALDDVGAHPDSLALLDLVMPDVVKLDLALIQRTPLAEQARTLSAVMAHSERTGAIVLAEGIETDAHLVQAQALGATLGQGWALGRPGALPPAPSRPFQPVVFGSPPSRPARTPFDLIARRMVLRVGPKHLLLAFSRHLEEMAMSTMDPPVVLSTLQTAARLTNATATRYDQLAAGAPLVALFGAGLSGGASVGGVRTVCVDDDDPLLQEWTVVVLGAHTSAALIARDLGDAGPDRDRRFEFVITYDRDLVTRAARSLTARLS